MSEHTCVCIPGHECAWEVVLRGGWAGETPRSHATPTPKYADPTPPPSWGTVRSLPIPAAHPGDEPPLSSSGPRAPQGSEPGPRAPRAPYPTPTPGHPPPTCHYRWSARSRGLLPRMWLLGGGPRPRGPVVPVGRGQMCWGCWPESTPAGPEPPEALLLGSASWDPSQGEQELADRPREVSDSSQDASGPGSCLPRFWALWPYLPAPCLSAVGSPHHHCGEAEPRRVRRGAGQLGSTSEPRSLLL